MKIHLIDGTYELFRCFFGAPKQSAPDGREVGAVRVLASSLLKLLREEATHVGVAFDTVIESFRNELFDGYKTGAGIEPELWNQFPLAEELVRALGLTCWSMVEFEADDALAAAAHKWSAEVEQVVICTPDKDLMQCVVGDQVVSYDRRRDTVYNEAGVIEKFGIPPVSIPDYLALVGDAADGIPGLSRWGAKSTATVLAHYGKLENIPDDSADWDIKVRGAKNLAAVLAESRADAELYRRLAILRTDVPLEESLEDLEWKGADRAKLEAWCERIGDAGLLGRAPRFRDGL